MKDLSFTRHRRLRSSASMRALVRETHLHKEDLIYPIFIIDGEKLKMKSALCQAFISYQWIILKRKWMKSQV